MEDDAWLRQLQQMAIDRPLVEIGAGSSALAEPDPEPDPAEPPAPIEQRIAALERSVEQLSARTTAALEDHAAAVGVPLAALEASVVTATRQVAAMIDLMRADQERFDELETLLAASDPSPGLTRVGSIIEARLRAVETALDGVIRAEHELAGVVATTADSVADLRPQDDRGLRNLASALRRRVSRDRSGGVHLRDDGRELGPG